MIELKYKHYLCTSVVLTAQEIIAVQSGIIVNIIISEVSFCDDTSSWLCIRMLLVLMLTIHGVLSYSQVRF